MLSVRKFLVQTQVANPIEKPKIETRINTMQDRNKENFNATYVLINELFNLKKMHCKSLESTNSLAALLETNTWRNFLNSLQEQSRKDNKYTYLLIEIKNFFYGATSKLFEDLPVNFSMNNLEKIHTFTQDIELIKKDYKNKVGKLLYQHVPLTDAWATAKQITSYLEKHDTIKHANIDLFNDDLFPALLKEYVDAHSNSKIEDLPPSHSKKVKIISKQEKEDQFITHLLLNFMQPLFAEVNSFESKPTLNVGEIENTHAEDLVSNLENLSKDFQNQIAIKHSEFRSSLDYNSLSSVKEFEKKLKEINNKKDIEAYVSEIKHLKEFDSKIDLLKNRLSKLTDKDDEKVKGIFEGTLKAINSLTKARAEFMIKLINQVSDHGKQAYAINKIAQKALHDLKEIMKSYEVECLNIPKKINDFPTNRTSKRRMSYTNFYTVQPPSPSCQPTSKKEDHPFGNFPEVKRSFNSFR